MPDPRSQALTWEEWRRLHEEHEVAAEYPGGRIQRARCTACGSVWRDSIRESVAYLHPQQY